MSYDKDAAAVDIADVQPSRGDYICPFCGVLILAVSLHTERNESEEVSPDTDYEVQCPSCGYKLNPITDQTKHASKLTPKITEAMIADEDDEDDDIVFETLDEDSGRVADEDEDDYFAEDDKRDEESLERKGYRILSSNYLA